MNSPLITHKSFGITSFSIAAFDETNLVFNRFTSRVGGVSPAPYNTLNLGFNTGDKKENVLKNYQLLCKAIQIPIENCVLSDQVHGDRIHIVTEADRGKGILKDSDIRETDALITNRKNVALLTLYADCVPLYLLDPVNKVIGLAHAGWRGTVKKIAVKTLTKMGENFGTKPENCLAAIGPSIGACCYEVDRTVADRFNENFTNPDKFVFYKDINKYSLNLWETNKSSLEEIGVLERNITISNLCTKCNNHILFSYRADRGITGRMVAVLQLI